MSLCFVQSPFENVPLHVCSQQWNLAFVFLKLSKMFIFSKFTKISYSIQVDETVILHWVRPKCSLASGRYELFYLHSVSRRSPITITRPKIFLCIQFVENGFWVFFRQICSLAFILLCPILLFVWKCSISFISSKIFLCFQVAKVVSMHLVCLRYSVAFSSPKIIRCI